MGTNSVYVQLLGNHEIMNINGEMHDVSAWDDQVQTSAPGGETLRDERHELFQEETSPVIGKWLSEKGMIVRVADPESSNLAAYGPKLWGIDTCQSRYFKRVDENELLDLKDPRLDKVELDGSLHNLEGGTWGRMGPQEAKETSAAGHVGVFKSRCKEVTFEAETRSKLACRGSGGAVVFTHGGFSKESLLEQSKVSITRGRTVTEPTPEDIVDAINSLPRSYFMKGSSYASSVAWNRDLWRFSQGESEGFCSLLKGALQLLAANTLVVGHTRVCGMEAYPTVCGVEGQSERDDGVMICSC